MKHSIKVILICASGLLFFIYGSLQAIDSRTGSKSLKEIYQTGKIQFIPVLKITRDSFPQDVSLKSIVDFCLLKDRLYILDIGLSNIKILDESAKFILAFGQKGKGPGDLLAPSHIAAARDQLAVWEIGNRRFSTFTSAGKFIKTSKANQANAHTAGLRALDDGRIIMENEAFEKEPGGEYIQYSLLNLYSRDLDFIEILNKKKISRRAVSVKKGRFLVQPFQPDVYWDILPGNKFVIGYSGNYQVEIKSLNGENAIRFTHAYKPVKITGIDKNIFFDSIVSSGRNGRPSKGAGTFERENTVFPTFKPAFKKLITDCEGNILVFNYKEGELDSYKYKASCFDAFDSNGKFINHVKIEPREGIQILKILPAGGYVFWIIEQEDDFEVAIVKYRVR